MPRLSSATSALYVRLPLAEADKLDRAARELGVPKNALVSRLVSSLGEPDSARLPAGATEVATRRFPADPGGDRMDIGFHSFQPHELPEVLTAEQAGRLLQLAESVVIELADSGTLPGRRLGREWRFSRSGLVTWLAHSAAP